MKWWNMCIQCLKVEKKKEKNLLSDYNQIPLLEMKKKTTNDEENIFKKQIKICIIFTQIDKKYSKMKDIPEKISWNMLQRQETKHERE